MSEHSYRLECVDRHGVPISGLSDAQLEGVLWELNGPGSIKYNMQQSSDFIKIPQENINEVQCWIDDQLQQWAIHHKVQTTPKLATFDCPGILQYFQFRYVLNTSLFYDTIEQLTIAADIITQMQALSGQDWNVGIYPYTSSGVPRSRNYAIDDHQNCLDMISEFPTLADALGVHTGFDFEIDVHTNPGLRQFRMYYPYKGSHLANIKLEWGRNITDYTNNVDGSTQGNNCYYTGGSNGDIKFENHAKNVASIATYGEWQTVQSKNDENDVTVLLELAQNYSSEHSTPLKSTEVTAVETSDDLLGVVKTGDWIWVDIENGRDSFHKECRINTIEWKPGPGNLKIGFLE